MSKQDICTSTITGNLVRDPEEKTAKGANGKEYPLAELTVANNGKDESPEYIKVNVWGERRHPILQHLRKGRHVTVVGSMRAKPWLDMHGNPKAGLVIDADSVDFGERPKEPAPMESPQAAKPTGSEPAQLGEGFYDKDEGDLPF